MSASWPPAAPESLQPRAARPVWSACWMWRVSVPDFSTRSPWPPSPAACMPPSASVRAGSQPPPRRRSPPRRRPTGGRQAEPRVRRSSLFERHLRDAALVDALYDDAIAVERELVAGPGYAPQHRIHEPTHCRDLGMCDGGTERDRQVVQAGASIHPDPSAVLSNRRRGLRVMLVADLAHDFLENVLTGDQSRGPTELVDDDRDVRGRSLEVAQLIVERFGFRNERRGPHQRLPARARFGEPHRDGHEVLGEHDAPDVV